ncbi:LamG domain-containing protein [Flavobacterium sp. ZS1P14]|uniref:LamG domain-containing protein n=1 Tax=Flavobacterium sp. ZS1P14 TaxID=3401729 RepID=UPI003AACC09B
MKINKSILKKAFGIAFISLVFTGCQEMDRPVLGDYPKDANAVGGPLKFYVPFDDTATDPLKFAVDNIRAKFPTDNPLTPTEGISGKGIKGGVAKKFIAYPSANDFAKTASSFTVAFWSKRAVPTQTEFAFALTSDNWAKASMFLLMEGTAAKPIVKLFVDEQGTGDHWFEWVNGDSVPGLFDDQWHHLAFVYDAATSKMSFYKDGVKYADKSWNNHGAVKFNASRINGFRIGGSGNPEEGWMNSWTGSFDNFRLYNTALPLADVQTLFAEKK